jgi:hypothetical protein
MTSCPSPEQLIRLLEEELDEADEAIIVVHVESCPGCQHRLEELICGRPLKPHGQERSVAPSPSSSSTAYILHQAGDKTKVASPPHSGAAATNSFTVDLTPTSELQAEGDTPSARVEEPLPSSRDTADLNTSQAPDPQATCNLNPLPPTHPILCEIRDQTTDLSFEARTQDENNRNAAQIPGYEILAKLGQGGMGVVYKARQRGLNRLVALKMIIGGSQARDDHLARFRVEAEAVARLRHPNILQIYDIR